jgi:glycosyltransferase involved in cell wall biosynthesis
MNLGQNATRNARISVITRAHNSENFIRNAIDSALGQTFPRELYEILVIDDGSADNTQTILKTYTDAVRVVKTAGLGPIKAANLGVSSAKGYYYILLDSDDILDSKALEEFYDKIVQSRSDFVYSDYLERDVQTGDEAIISLKDNIFNSVAGGILFKRNLVLGLGGYDESLVFPEYDLLIRLIDEGRKCAYISKPLFTYTRHQESLTADKELVKRGLDQLRSKYGKKVDIRSY